MIAASFSYFDAAVIAILALSCLFAFWRGFVKEILSLGAWIGAGIITVYYFRDVADMLRPHFKTEEVAGGLAALGLYVSTLLMFSIINALLLRYVKDGGDVGFLDNSLGLAFGAVRAAFILSLGYFMMTMVMTKDDFPGWLSTARTRPYVEEGARMLAQASPEYLRELSWLSNGDAGKVTLFGKKAGENEEKTADGNDKREMNELLDRINKMPSPAR